MRTIAVSMSFALSLSLACGGESTSITDASLGDTTETVETDAVEASSSGDATHADGTDSGGSKGDALSEGLLDASASDGASQSADADGVTKEPDGLTSPDAFTVPEVDASSSDAEAFAPHGDAVQMQDAQVEGDASLKEDTTSAEQDVASDVWAQGDAATSEDVAIEDTQGPVDTGVEVSLCEACIASGGTWQPEANACTENCNIMDISCYTTSCPEPCSLESCGTCIGQAECEEMGCQWNAQPPAFWCNSFNP